LQQPGLLTEERINSPPAIDPDFNAHLGNRSVEIKDID
jgi:hypothetical protein